MPIREPKNLAELLRNRATASRDAIGIVYRDHRLSWHEVFQRAGRVAQALQANGVGRGDVIGILAPHSPAQVAALFGIALTDAAFSIINPLLKPTQMQHQVADSSMRAIIGTRDGLGILEGQLDKNVLRIEIREDGNLTNYEDGAPDIAIGPTKNIPVDIANIIYTSGSTGRPKGVVVPHRTVLDGAR
ncbi:MAG: AMP-binding protein, partial [Nannocystaceae bacterium]